MAIMSDSLPLRTNEQITAPTVGLRDETAPMVRQYSLADAPAYARRAGRDLIEVAPKYVPPLCEISNLQKYNAIGLADDLAAAQIISSPAELDLIRRYEYRGIRSGYGLLLLPENAVHYAEDAAASGMGILGPEYWYSPSWEWWPAPDYSAMARDDDFVRKSLERAKDDIQNHFPEEVAFVLLVLQSDPPTVGSIVIPVSRKQA